MVKVPTPLSVDMVKVHPFRERRERARERGRERGREREREGEGGRETWG